MHIFLDSAYALVLPISSLKLKIDCSGKVVTLQLLPTVVRCAGPMNFEFCSYECFQQSFAVR